MVRSGEFLKKERRKRRECSFSCKTHNSKLGDVGFHGMLLGHKRCLIFCLLCYFCFIYCLSHYNTKQHLPYHRIINRLLVVCWYLIGWDLILLCYFYFIAVAFHLRAAAFHHMRKTAMVRNRNIKQGLPRSYKKKPLSTFTKQSFFPL